jgi:hypothetical protein
VKRFPVRLHSIAAFVFCLKGRLNQFARFFGDDSGGVNIVKRMNRMKMPGKRKFGADDMKDAFVCIQRIIVYHDFRLSGNK